MLVARKGEFDGGLSDEQGVVPVAEAAVVEDCLRSLGEKMNGAPVQASKLRWVTEAKQLAEEADAVVGLVVGHPHW